MYMVLPTVTHGESPLKNWACSVSGVATQARAVNPEPETLARIPEEKVEPPKARLKTGKYIFWNSWLETDAIGH